MTSFGAALQTALVLSLLSCINTQQVTTTHGEIAGTRLTVNGKTVDVYYGIPYAKPPIGDLRFKHPVAADPWRPEVKDATEMKASCYQLPPSALGITWRSVPNLVSEDCLFINAWVPTLQQGSSKLSTMIWIYGGAFMTGSINSGLYNGQYLATEQNVIVMSINYRVGAHGFLYLSPETFPGNQGMMDQVLGMEWIYENVERFGGDRNSITLFGESAGAAAVGHHLLSPLSKNFFNRAIMESGVPIADWAARAPAVGEYVTNQLAKMCDCSTVSKADTYNCLRMIDPEIIVQKHVKGNLIGPIVDGYFLPEWPKKLLENGQIKQANILIGANKAEGNYFLNDLFPNISENFTITKRQFDQLFGKTAPVGEAIYAQYVDTKLAAFRKYAAIAGDIFADNSFVCPTMSFINTLTDRSNNSVFMYSFERLLSTMPFPEWFGASHTFELEFVFGHLLGNAVSGTQDEILLSRSIMQYWAQFAKTGNPNQNGMVEPTWPKYDPVDEKYLVLDLSKRMKVQQGLKKQDCAFWNKIVPIILKNDKVENTRTVCTNHADITKSSTSLAAALLTVMMALYTWI